MRFAFVILTGVLVASCEGPGATAPRSDVTRWHRIQTEHFELATDLPAVDAARAAEQLERTRSALRSAAWKDAPDRSSSRSSVVVLADGLEFEHYVGPEVGGFFTSSPRPTIVLWGAPEKWERRLNIMHESTTSPLRHELAHRLAAGIYLRQPRWFAEGIAQFLEPLVVEDDGVSAIVGRINMQALGEYKGAHPIGAAEALAWTHATDRDEEQNQWRLYGVSWLLVHWLYNTHSAAFADYQVSLAKGVDPTVAWSKSFPDLTPAAIDVALHDYAQHGKFTETRVAIEKTTPKLVDKPITEADVHALRAQIAAAGARIRATEAAERRASLQEEARLEIERSLASEPANALALRMARTIKVGPPPTEWAARLRAQVAKRPDDGDAWLLLGETLDAPATRAESEAALRKALPLLPGDSNAYNELAWVLVEEGRGDDALPLATKAALLAPWDAAILDTYAAALDAVHRCPDALRVQRRAVDLLPESARTNDGRQIKATLERYRKSCGEGQD